MGRHRDLGSNVLLGTDLILPHNEEWIVRAAIALMANGEAGGELLDELEKAAIREGRSAKLAGTYARILLSGLPRRLGVRHSVELYRRTLALAVPNKGTLSRPLSAMRALDLAHLFRRPVELKK